MNTNEDQSQTDRWGGWTPVYSHVPPDGQPVLFVYQDAQMSTPSLAHGHRDEQDGRWWSDLVVGDGAYIGGVICWRPLPAMPSILEPFVPPAALQELVNKAVFECADSTPPVSLASTWFGGPRSTKS